MKKTTYLGIFIVIVLCVITQYGGISHAGPTGVVGSNHDLSFFYSNAAFTGNDTGGPFRYETDEVCVFCHTPHNANGGVRGDTIWDGSGFTNDAGAYGGEPIMLWNRSLDQNGGAPATSQILTYNSPTMDSYTGQVWAYSLMCLSCHDGVQALNVLHSYPADAAGGPIVPDGGSGPTRFGQVPFLPANIGERDATALPGSDDGIVHLENDHPVSIDYPNAQSADGGLEVATIAGNSGYVQDAKVRLFPRPSDGARRAMECSTCHDVHNEGSNSPTAPVGVRFKYPFLNVTIAGSYLCTRCHRK